jgi:hypothetical protein
MTTSFRFFVVNTSNSVITVFDTVHDTCLTAKEQSNMGNHCMVPISPDDYQENYRRRNKIAYTPPFMNYKCLLLGAGETGKSTFCTSNKASN